MENFRNLLLGAGLAVAALTSCAGGGQSAVETVSGLNPANFDTTLNGKKTELITIKNSNGMEVCLTNYGGRVVSICVPDKDGKPTDVVLGYDNIKQYADTLNSPSDYGSSVGRYANRIKDSKIVVDGKTYQLRANDNENCLHGGGNTGWLNKVYDVQEKTDSSVTFAITAPDGENGFPGTVKATATYVVKSNNTLDITFGATTDKETVVNMTNHSYFNLNGDPSKEGVDQVMYINADKFTPADAKYIPTGEIKEVTGTPMDFRKAHAIGETIVDTLIEATEESTNLSKEVMNEVFGDYVKKGKTILVSNFYGNVNAVLSQFGLDDSFSQVIESAVVGVRKPDPEIWRMGLRAIGVSDPSKALVIGDSYDKDIIPAHEIGCDTLWFMGEGWTPVIPDGAKANWVMTSWFDVYEP